MQERSSIEHYLPILAALLFSVIIHAVFWGRALSRPSTPQPLFQSGRTTVQLTLLPSPARPKPTPPPPSPPEKKQEEAKIPEPKPVVQKRPEPAPIPLEEPQPAPEKSLPKEEPTQKQEKPLSPPPKPVVHQKEQPPAEQSPSSTEPSSAGQDATLIKEKGVQTEAKTLRAVSPVYPRLSRRRGEEGTVVFTVWISKKGKVEKIKILHSSGYKRLDDSALKAAKKTRFQPAIKNGQAVPSQTELTFTFRLTDEK